jgi:hypothetical protein
LLESAGGQRRIFVIEKKERAMSCVATTAPTLTPLLIPAVIVAFRYGAPVVRRAFVTMGATCRKAVTSRIVATRRESAAPTTAAPAPA